MANPLTDWRVDPGQITTTGTDLRRPECVLAERNGTLWAADLRGGVLGIAADGSQRVVRPAAGGGPFAPEPFVPGIIPDGTEGLSLPNGLAFDVDGSFLVANFGTKVLEHLTRDGTHRVVLDQLDGQSLGQTNFVLRDRSGRLWFTVTTRQDPWTQVGRARIADGYVGLIDASGARIVADHFAGTNEVRLDPNEEWLYVVETSGSHISRLRVQSDGSLTDRQVYGPEDLGGRPDGMAFDAYGNLWITLVSHDRLVALTPEGDVLPLWDDGDPEAKASRDRAERQGSVTPELVAAARGRLAPRMASVTFGGEDLSTVYVGSLLGTTLPTFRSPVPGQPMVHWNASWST
ncbi:MAG: SMP-30/gluconolactonase/LRE family protein [Chloroflexi bacterium]|nr:SMP-30/gluconolactonase/LRE family protein [Chloroflexota bacterium]